MASKTKKSTAKIHISTPRDMRFAFLFLGIPVSIEIIKPIAAGNRTVGIQAIGGHVFTVKSLNMISQ